MSSPSRSSRKLSGTILSVFRERKASKETEKASENSREASKEVDINREVSEDQNDIASKDVETPSNLEGKTSGNLDVLPENDNQISKEKQASNNENGRSDHLNTANLVKDNADLAEDNANLVEAREPKETDFLSLMESAPSQHGKTEPALLQPNEEVRKEETSNADKKVRKEEISNSFNSVEHMQSGENSEYDEVDEKMVAHEKLPCLLTNTNVKKSEPVYVEREETEKEKKEEKQKKNLAEDKEQERENLANKHEGEIEVLVKKEEVSIENIVESDEDSIRSVTRVHEVMAETVEEIHESEALNWEQEKTISQKDALLAEDNVSKEEIDPEKEVSKEESVIDSVQQQLDSVKQDFNPENGDEDSMKQARCDKEDDSNRGDSDDDEELLDDLNQKKENLINDDLTQLLPSLNIQREEAEMEELDFPFDLRRSQLITRLYELLVEHSDPSVGVIQQDAANLFVKAGLSSGNTFSPNVFFYTIEEVNEGCLNGPTVPFFDFESNSIISPESLDSRLFVTQDIFETLVQEVTNLELAQAIDLYIEHTEQLETSWAIDCPLKDLDGDINQTGRTFGGGSSGASGRESSGTAANARSSSQGQGHGRSSVQRMKLKAVNGLAMFENHIYVSDSMNHAIFRIKTDSKVKKHSNPLSTAGNSLSTGGSSGNPLSGGNVNTLVGNPTASSTTGKLGSKGGLNQQSLSQQIHTFNLGNSMSLDLGNSMSHGQRSTTLLGGGTTSGLTTLGGGTASTGMGHITASTGLSGHGQSSSHQPGGHNPPSMPITHQSSAGNESTKPNTLELFAGKLHTPGFRDGPRNYSQFNAPGGMVVCKRTETLYVCDTKNDAIRSIDLISGLVQTLTVQSVDFIGLTAPVDICLLHGEFSFENEEESSDSDTDAVSENTDTDADSQTGKKTQLEGIQEEDLEDEESVGGYDMKTAFAGGRESIGNIPGFTTATVAAVTAPNFGSGFGVGSAGGGPAQLGIGGGLGGHSTGMTFQDIDEGGFRSGLEDGDPSSLSEQRKKMLENLRRRSTRFSLADEALFGGGGGYHSNKSSARSSRRTSRAYTTLDNSLNTTRRTSLNFFFEDYRFRGLGGGDQCDRETVIESLRQLSNSNQHLAKLPDLAIACDHSVFVIKRNGGSGTFELSLVAGHSAEYGYRDAAKGSDARFSSLKGLCSIRNSIFVCDHWNNCIRCINLKTTSVDTVSDFQPDGPLKLAVSESGYLYVLDTDKIHFCNILKICSAQEGVEGAADGTTSESGNKSEGGGGDAGNGKSDGLNALKGATLSILQGSSLQSVSRRGSSVGPLMGGGNSGNSVGNSNHSSSRRASSVDSVGPRGRSGSMDNRMTSGHLNSLGQQNGQQSSGFGQQGSPFMPDSFGNSSNTRASGMGIVGVGGSGMRKSSFNPQMGQTLQVERPDQPRSGSICEIPSGGLQPQPNQNGNNGDGMNGNPNQMGQMPRLSRGPGGIPGMPGGMGPPGMGNSLTPFAQQLQGALGGQFQQGRGSKIGEFRGSKIGAELVPPDQQVSRSNRPSAVPEVPAALKSLVPGASLHPALFQIARQSMAVSRKNSAIQPGNGDGGNGTVMGGSIQQSFRVSVASSLSDFEDDRGFDVNDRTRSIRSGGGRSGVAVASRAPIVSSWHQVPFSLTEVCDQLTTLNGNNPHITFERSFTFRSCTQATPLCLAFMDFSDTDGTSGLEHILDIENALIRHLPQFSESANRRNSGNNVNPNSMRPGAGPDSFSVPIYSTRGVKNSTGGLNMMNVGGTSSPGRRGSKRGSSHSGSHSRRNSSRKNSKTYIPNNRTLPGGNPITGGMEATNPIYSLGTNTTGNMTANPVNLDAPNIPPSISRPLESPKRNDLGSLLNADSAGGGNGGGNTTVVNRLIDSIDFSMDPFPHYKIGHYSKSNLGIKPTIRSSHLVDTTMPSGPRSISEGDSYGVILGAGGGIGVGMGGGGMGGPNPLSNHLNNYNKYQSLNGQGFAALIPKQHLFVGLSDAPFVLKITPPNREWLPSDVAGTGGTGSGGKKLPRFQAVAVDSKRCLMSDSASHQVFVVNHSKLTKDRIAGCGKAGFLDGPLDICRMNRPVGLALDSHDFIYVADALNHRIRCINLSTGFMSTVCGSGIRGCQDSIMDQQERVIHTGTLDTPYSVQFYSPHYLLITCADNSVRRFDLKKRCLVTLLVGS